MRIGLFLLTGILLPLHGAVIFPATADTTATGCSLPLPYSPQAAAALGDLQANIFLKTDSGTVNVTGVSEQGSFLRNRVLPAVVGPAGINLPIAINPAALTYGHNKAYIGFLTDMSSAYAALVTVDVNCFPTPTISLVKEILDVSLTEGSSPGSVLVPNEVQGADSNAGAYVKNPIRFTLTPDTVNTSSPWIVSASTPGSPANTGTVAPGGKQDLSVSLNPAGLLAQSDPYVGYVHVRDNNTGYGSADLTVRLTVSAAVTGNAALPHFAANGPYVTGFYVVNAGAQPANFMISFYDDAGKAFPLPVQGLGTASSIPGNLPANGSAYYEVGDANLPLAGGSARVTADASINVQSLFRLHQQDSQGSRYYEAAVPATLGSKEFVIPFDATTFGPTNEQTFTGIAIANLDFVSSSNINCTARDSSGNTIPNAVVIQPDLPPNGHWAGFNFPPLLGKRGTLDCVANTTIAAIALHAYANGAITSLPVLLK